MREVLAEIGYVGWPKTSGNRGVHVFCRIEPDWEFLVGPARGARLRAGGRAAAPEEGDDRVVEGGTR